MNDRGRFSRASVVAPGPLARGPEFVLAFLDEETFMTVKPFPGGLALPMLLISAALLPALAPARGQEPPAGGQTPTNPATPAISERIEVTATRVPEDVEPVPSSITILTGDELQARGAFDLESALALAAGVAIAPGGDAGPASAVPELWGLREFDAFLLVVDGVPAGGAFNPALSTLDLNGVDRIEILRGAAPVLYGATSFVGVIHVIHRGADAKGGTARIYGGSYGSGGAAVTAGLPAIGNYQQSLIVNGEKQGYRDDRTEVDRGHLLYRGAVRSGAGAFHLDFDAAINHQKPPSPVPAEGPRFTPLVPLDSNVNPLGSKIDEDRYQLTGGYDRSLGSAGSWSTTLALTRTDRTVGRGFLTEVSDEDPNANGFRQDLTLDDLYFDSHLAWDPRPGLRLVAGVDHLYGNADLHSGDFDYFASPDGREVPRLSDLPPAGDLRLKDKRNFSGLYLQTEWSPTARWRFQVGARLNHTRETQDTRQGEVGEPAGVTADERTVTRGSGSAGLSWLAWQSGKNALWLYADYRNTFKPAALDFGPDAEGDILKPETAESYEIGAKGLLGDLRWDLSVFQMDFSNLVVARLVDGLPGLVNAGEERFKGFELEAQYRLRPDLSWQLSYSNHDARFRDFASIFDQPEPEQVRGNRLPLSARDMAATGLTYAPAHGLSVWALYSWVGDRFLDEVNEVLAPSYGTWSAGVRWAFDRFAIRFEGFNINDTRPPVALSELGGGQVYLLPARSLRLTLDTHF
jgi:outer membrane receptor protein involved in Fe transport